MSAKLAPSAVTPPSWKRRACTPSTAAIASSARHGPSSTAARVAPTRWPLVPGATGTLTSCAAKRNAATEPRIPDGTVSPSRLSARSAAARVPPATTHDAAATPGLKNPSGMCIGSQLRGAHDELPVLDALQTDQVIGDVPNRRRPPAQREHFETRVVVQVDVHRREDLVVVIVAGGDDAIRQVALAVSVDEREARHRLAAAPLPRVLDETLADQVAHRLGAVGRSRARDQRVEALDQGLVDRQADPLELHARSGITNGRNFIPARYVGCQRRRRPSTDRDARLAAAGGARRVLVETF